MNPIMSNKEMRDFSLVQGGPLFQILLRAGLVGPSMSLLARRIVVIAAIAWLPLLIATLVSGHAIGGIALPFLRDVGTHTRLLLGVPLFIAAEIIVHRSISATVDQFVVRDIIAIEDRPEFERIAASAMKLRNSRIAELLLFLFVVTGGYFIGGRYVSMDLASWYAVPISGDMQLTAAGYWYVFVSLNIFRFLLARWYFRLFIWYRFLWQVACRVPLQLNALHPDRAGGIGFLAGSIFAFQPVVIAHTIVLAGVFAGRIWNEGASLLYFKMEIAFWVVMLVTLILLPLCFFATHLSATKRSGLREYGVVGSRYVDEFRKKWISKEQSEEALIGTADIQSLADLSNSFQMVQEMRLVPFSSAAALRLGALAVIPFAPLLLTMIPLEELIDRAFGALL